MVRRRHPSPCRAGFDAVLRGEVTTHLLPFAYLQIESGINELAEEEAGGPTQAARHNASVRKLKAENALKRTQLASGQMAIKNSLAQHLFTSLMPKTGLRLK